MNHRRALIAAAVAVVLAVPGAALVAAQQKRASPHETVKAAIDGGNVTITYGRPFAKGRKIFGGLVPYGQVWRTGADEATILETDKMLMLGPLHLNPGKVLALLARRRQDVEAGGQQAGRPVGHRVPAGPGPGPRRHEGRRRFRLPVEQFTITLDKGAGGKGGVLTMQWETRKATLAFTTM